MENGFGELCPGGRITPFAIPPRKVINYAKKRRNKYPLATERSYKRKKPKAEKKKEGGSSTDALGKP